MKTVSVPTAFLIVIILAGLSMAWAQHDHHNAGGHSSTSNDQDKREFVRFPDALREHTLSNMRDHLLALQEIQLHLGLGHNDIAAIIAESRLGMSSLSLHGAAEVAKYMPQGMQDAGTAMHHAASRLAIVVQDAAVTGDSKPVFTGMADLTAQCVGCHAGYRLQ
jgi:hypothetical protein